jgi:hypothetical protein
VTASESTFTPPAGMELEVRPESAPNLFGTSEPRQVIATQKAYADALADVIQKRQLFTIISGKAYVHVDAWTLLGSMLGVFPIVEWTREVEDGWEARVIVKTKAGEIVGAAEAECRRNERAGGKQRWKDANSHAIRSMAQTRAISRAMRGPLGFIVQLAGYQTEDVGDRPVTTDQHRKLAATLKELEQDGAPVPEGYQTWEDYSRDWAVQQFGVTSRSELTVAEMSQLIEHIASMEVPL